MRKGAPVTLRSIALFVLAAIGWSLQAVGEYRLSQSAGHAARGDADHGDTAPQVDHITAAGH